METKAFVHEDKTDKSVELGEIKLSTHPPTHPPTNQHQYPLEKT